MPAGRPTKYKNEYAEQARKLCLLGFTDEQLADFFETTKQTINAWKKKHPKFLDSLKRGKDKADAEVAASLYERACGYSHPEDKIVLQDGAPVLVPTVKHYPPDTAAMIVWLTNRQPGKWRNKQNVEHEGEVKGVVPVVNLTLNGSSDKS